MIVQIKESGDPLDKCQVPLKMNSTINDATKVCQGAGANSLAHRNLSLD